MATEAQIKHMADRFLGWKLPAAFSPDAGITFNPVFNEGTAHPMRHEPRGTNLFDASEAEAMVRFMVEGMSKREETLPRATEAQADKAISEIKKAINAAENANQAGEDIVVLMARAPELHQRICELEDMLDRCAEFIDGQVDVQDGDYGEPEPNKAMRLMTAIREVVPESPALERPTAPGMGGGL